jgi:TrmH family RNA methyltransferase
MQAITSTANPRIKQIVRLQSQPRQRRKAGQFCVETHRELGRALEAGCEMIELYVLDDAHTAGDCDAWIEHAKQTGAACFEVNRDVLAKIAYRQNPQGLVAVLAAPSHTLDAFEPGDAGPYVVCSGLEKPGNLGAILRSASGAGVAGVLIDAPSPDLYNPNCVRASTGAVFSVPIACDTAENLIDWLSARSIRVVALTPEAETSYDQLDWSTPTAIALGAEAEGLDPLWRDAADQHGATVSIPMRGADSGGNSGIDSGAGAGAGADSLNVSVAAALVMYEATKTR